MTLSSFQVKHRIHTQLSMSTYELPESIKQVCLITDFREMVTVKVIRRQKSYAIQ